MTARGCRGSRGQASVELLGFAPLVLAIAIAVVQLVAAGAAHELAGHAAEAGAVALLEGADPQAAARDALPGWSRARVTVRVRGRSVAVRLRPVGVVPGASGLLSTEASADAGPAS